ncbi:MAG TPA: dienelactone hydrolase family protein [Vicinamibacterales bacterium]|nr:dienelactone hydrolase family protein [Vicinamibacterales bacterium]
MEQHIIDLYREYSLGGMTRRIFFERLAQVAGGAAAALALMPALEAQGAPQAGTGPIVPENDPALATGKVEYDGGDAKIAAYLARPKGGGKRPAVLVIHENRGLTPHIEDVARRLAKEGFLALAPDMLSPLGGTPADQQQAPKMIGTLDQAQTVARLAAGVRFLAAHPESTGKVGVVGFCWGGAMTNRVMASGAGAAAGVPYYGSVLPADQVPRISGPLLLQYAGDDARINAGIPDFEAALKASNKPYEKHIYEGAQHAFNNNTNPARYNKEAADLAWQRTVAFFRKQLM